MHKATKLPMLNVNQHVLCILCGGYLIDATTIIECLHSFCRSCIVRYLETSKYCPICDVQVHKTRPLLNIRSDKTLQDLVYKLVPGLFQNEMMRRREFYASNKEPDEVMARLSKEEKGELDEKSMITEDENISICIQHTDQLPPYKNGSSTNFPERRKYDFYNRRYLLVPAGFTIGLLKKFIFLKYDLSSNFRIGIVHSDDVLSDEFTLMDIAYIYGWRRLEPLKLYYIVVDRNLLSPQPLPEVADKPVSSTTPNITDSNDVAESTLVVVPDSCSAPKLEDTTSQSATQSEEAMDLSVGTNAQPAANGAKLIGVNPICVASTSSEDEESGDYVYAADSGTVTPVPHEDSNALSDSSLAKIVVITPDRPISDSCHTSLKEKAMANASSVAKKDSVLLCEGKGKETAKIVAKNKRPKSKSGDDPNSDPQLRDAINKVLEVLSEDSSEKENQTTDDEQTTHIKSDNSNTSKPEKKITPSVNGNDSNTTKVKPVLDNSHDTSKEYSSSDEVPRLVIIEPERSDSVHSDKENQAVLNSSTIPKQPTVSSNNVPEPMDTRPVSNQSDSSQVPLPVYTVQPLSSTNTESKVVSSNGTTKVVIATAEDKQLPVPSRPQKEDGKKRPETFVETVIKRKRGRPPKVPKDPSQNTPPKIARILPKGLPPHTGFVQPSQGGMPNMMNMMAHQMVAMPYNGQNGMSNGQMVFVQNMGNQSGGQMMVQQNPGINGMNPQGIGNQIPAMNCVNQGMVQNMQPSNNPQMNNVQMMNTQTLPSSQQGQPGMMPNSSMPSGQMISHPMMANQPITNNQMPMSQQHMSMFNQQISGNTTTTNSNMPMVGQNQTVPRVGQQMIRGSQPMSSLSQPMVPTNQHMVSSNLNMNTPPRPALPNSQRMSHNQQPLPPHMRMPPPTFPSAAHMRLPMSAHKVFPPQQLQQVPQQPPPPSIATSNSQTLNNGYDAPLELTTKRSSSQSASVNPPSLLKVPAPPLQQPMPS